MKRNLFNLIIVFMLTGLLAACGSGGGGTTPPGNINNPGGGGETTGNKISGVASKGLIDGGIVKIYALDADGNPGKELGTAKTAVDGKYSVDIGTYTGNVIVEVSGGIYKDEATGESRTNTMLRAALAGVSDSVSVAVTPWTELAVRYAGTLTKNNIEAANSLVSSIVNANIISTMPADVTSQTSATVDETTYGFALAMISQMASDKGADVATIIGNIEDDLSDDNKLSATGADLMSSLTSFLESSNNNTTVDSFDETKLNEAILAITILPVEPPDDVSDLEKAKALVADLRNTALSIYNYEGNGVPGVVETPFKNLSDEMETRIEPELALTADMLEWIVQSADYGTGIYDDSVSDLSLVINVTSSANDIGVSEVTYEIIRTSDNETRASGKLTVQNDLYGRITSGTIAGTLRTTSGGTVTVDLNYSATIDNGLYKEMTFTGLITVTYTGSSTPWLTMDFSQEGRRLNATFAQIPGSTEFNELYPTSIFFSGRIATQTAQMDGELNIPSLVWANDGYTDWDWDTEICYGEFRPEEAVFKGAFSELKDGAPTGVKFSGTITGNWDNASSYNGCIDEGIKNFAKLDATFDGKIEAPARPTITAFLKAAVSGYRTYILDVSYTRTDSDNAVVSLSGNGTVIEKSYTDRPWDTYAVLTADLSNQDGLNVAIAHDGSKSRDNRLSGTISSPGGTVLAVFYTINGVPSVKYNDNYFESIFSISGSGDSTPVPPVTPPYTLSDLEKAKALVADLRNTVLSIYNYEGAGVPGVVETPFKNLSVEMETRIEPELTLTTDRLEWIVQSAGYGTGEYDYKGLGLLKLVINVTPSVNDIGVSEVTYQIIRISDNELRASGALTVQNDAYGRITSGTIAGTLRTTSGGTVAVALDYTAIVENGLYKDMTFTGSMSVTDTGALTPWLTLDFSEEGRRLHATYAQIPGSTNFNEIYPTSIFFSGRIATQTAQMDGELSIPSLVWADYGYTDWDWDTWQEACYGELRPEHATFKGSFSELQDGVATGVKFSGTIIGNWDNASDYDGCSMEGVTNFAKLDASFDGKIEATARPTITAFLKAAVSGYRTYTLDVSYSRTDSDNTVVSLSGNGTVTEESYTDRPWDTYGVLTANLSNQDGLKVAIANDGSKSRDNRLIGTISTPGGTVLADFYTINGVPVVKYSDNYIESIF